MYEKQAGQVEMSLSGIANLTKLTKKLTNIKVGSAALGIFLGIYSLRLFAASDLRSIFYAVAAIDLFRVSYNSFGRMYISIVAKQATTRQIGETVMSLFSGKSKNDSLLREITEEINWKYLVTGTMVSACYDKFVEFMNKN
jgi:hypothetical protein